MNRRTLGGLGDGNLFVRAFCRFRNDIRRPVDSLIDTRAIYGTVNILDESNQSALRYILIERVMRLTNGLQYRLPRTIR